MLCEGNVSSGLVAKSKLKPPHSFQWRSDSKLLSLWTPEPRDLFLLVLNNGLKSMHLLFFSTK